MIVGFVIGGLVFVFCLFGFVRMRIVCGLDEGFSRWRFEFGVGEFFGRVFWV